jgi:hypothetical protein
VWGTAPCWKRNCSLRFAVVPDFCPKASSFSMTMRDHAQLLQQVPPSRNWNLRPKITVHTSLHPTVMCLARLRKHCEDEDFTTTTRWRRGSISGFDNKQKLLFFYRNTEACRKMWKVYCKERWPRGKNNILFMMCEECRPSEVISWLSPVPTYRFWSPILIWSQDHFPSSSSHFVADCQRSDGAVLN